MADFVIIGNGVCGRKAAELIRKQDNRSSILMITDEPYPFYPRPQLSLGYLAGKVDKDRLFTAPDFYSRNAVSLLFGSVAGLKPVENLALMSDGGTLKYRTLLIASGASPAVPPWEGSKLDGVVSLRTLRDADGILERMAGEENVVVAGAGILGVEVSEALFARGKKVTLLSRGGKEAVGSPALPPEKAVQRCDAMVGNGVNIILDDEVEQLAGNGKLMTVHTKKGLAIESGLLIVTIGARPNTAFLGGSGIATSRGVVVDSELKTAFDNIFAAGDAAEVTGDGCEKQKYGSPYVNATKQGEYAAGRMIDCLKNGKY
jgi:NAD(P)H-nitrite reductase large subunit